MNRLLLKSLVGLSLLLIAAACSKGKKSSKRKGMLKNVQNVVETKSFDDSYRYIINGCDTGEQSFKAKSEKELKNKLCQGLQDHDKNNRCAESERQELFGQRCQGMTWSPLYNSRNKDHEEYQSEYYQQKSREEKRQDLLRRIYRALDNLEIQNVEINSELNKKEKSNANKLATDFINCGLSNRGPQCLEDINGGGEEIYAFQTLKDKHLVFFSIKNNSLDFPLGLVFEVKKENKILVTKHLYAYKILDAYDPSMSLIDYLENQQNVQKLFIAETHGITMLSLKAKVSNPENLIQQYHANVQLMHFSLSKNMESFKVNKIWALEQFKLNTKFLINSDQEIYQRYMLNRLKHSLEMDRADYLDLLENFVDSKQINLKQYSMINIFENDPSRVEFRDEIFSALDSKHWSIRLGAINALSKSNLNYNEEAIILLKLDDSDHNIRETVYAIFQNLELNEDNIPALSELSRSLRWSARRDAVRLIGKISGETATKLLIEMINDVNEVVRYEVDQQLSKRALNKKNLDDLEVVLNDEKWFARNTAAKFIGTIKHKKSIRILKKRLKIESNEAVSLMIRNIIAKLK